MDRNTQVAKNLELAQTLFEGLLDSAVESWPPAGTLIFLPDDDPQLAGANLKLARRIRRERPDDAITTVRIGSRKDGGSVTFRSIGATERRRQAAG